MYEVLNNKYADLYTWSHQLGDSVIAHHDGAVSVMVKWKGFDCNLLSTDALYSEYAHYQDYLHNLDKGYFIENHFFREKDTRAVDEFEKGTKNFVRGGNIAIFMREKICDHYRKFARTNEVFSVYTKPSLIPSVLQRFASYEKKLQNQTKHGEELLNYVSKVSHFLPENKLLSSSDYIKQILRAGRRDTYFNDGFRIDPFIFLNQQLVRKPELDEKSETLKIGTTHHKLILVPFYPDADPGWFLQFSNFLCDMHIVQIIRPADEQTIIRQSEKSEGLASENSKNSGVESSQAKVKHEKSFRKNVIDNNLSILRNCFIFHLYGNKDSILDVAETIKSAIAKRNGEVNMNANIQYSLYRMSMPGQGYKATFLRPDDSSQVVSMWPLQVFRSGDKKPTEMWLDNSGQPVSADLDLDEVNHTITNGKTGGGKDIRKQFTIWNEFPMGVDILGMEAGSSYWWSAQALAGEDSYIIADPNEHIISPFPEYRLANVYSDYPLDAEIVAGTIEAMGFLLIDEKENRHKLNQVEQAAAESALQMLYAVPEGGKEIPRFSDFHNVLKDPYYLDGRKEQQKASIQMASRLEAFIDTAHGRQFNENKNISIADNLCIFDLKPIQNDTRILRFYLVFLSLRFMQIAYSNPKPTRVILNEMHLFVKAAGDIMDTLMDGIARMGRKEGVILDIVTQENKEVDAMSKAILNSMAHKVCLYREGMWQDVGERLSMPQHVIDVWTNFKNPKNLKYRDCLYANNNEYYDLIMTFPQEFLDMAGTKKTELNIKKLITKKYSDPFDRLNHFRKELENIKLEEKDKENA